MLVRELLIRLGLTGGESAGRELDKVDGKVKQVTESFRSLGGVLTGVFAGLSLKSIIETADHMQSLEFRLGQMQTSVNGGAEAFDNLAKHAVNSRVSIESYAEAYTGIGAATHELIHTQEDLANVTDSVAMGLQLAGANAHQATSVMQQLTQAIAVGKLQWADLRIILQNSDAFALRLAESLGMTLNQLVVASQGQGGGIGADKIVKALRNMSGEVRKEFAEMPITVTQALTIIGVRWESFINRLNRSTASVSKIATWFLWLADKVEFAMTAFVESIGGAENAVELLTVAVGAAGLLGAISLLPAAIAVLTSPITRLIAGMVLLYAVGEDVYRWFNKQSSALGDAIGPVENYKTQIEGLRNGLTDLRDIAISLINAWGDLDKAFQDNAFTRWFIKSQDYTERLGQRFRNWALSDKDNTDNSEVEKGSLRWFANLSRDYNSEHRRERDFISNINYQQLGFPTSSKTVSINIGNIEIPAGSSDQQAQFIRDTAMTVFNDVGYRINSLGDDMLFNRGVSR